MRLSSEQEALGNKEITMLCYKSEKCSEHVMNSSEKTYFLPAVAGKRTYISLCSFKVGKWERVFLVTINIFW